MKAPIVKELSGKGYEILPVLFTTTHANETIRNKNTEEPAEELVQQLDKLCPKGWVVFDLKGVEKFTHRLGSMRHVIIKRDTTKESDVTGSLLASRPVWRATPSRVSHIPNHMWNTQPPPFGARMTAYVHSYGDSLNSFRRKGKQTSRLRARRDVPQKNPGRQKKKTKNILMDNSTSSLFQNTIDHLPPPSSTPTRHYTKKKRATDKMSGDSFSILIKTEKEYVDESFFFVLFIFPVGD